MEKGMRKIMKEIIKKILRIIVAFCIYVYCKIVYRIKVLGKENVPTEQAKEMEAKLKEAGATVELK